MILGVVTFGEVPFGDPSGVVAQPVVVSEDSYHQPFSFPSFSRIKAIAAIAMVAWSGFVGDPSLLTKPEAPHVDGYQRDLSEPIRVRPSLKTANQQFLAYVGADPFPGPVFGGDNFPEVFSSFGMQPFADNSQLAYIVAPIYEDAWHQPFSEPVRYKIKPALSVALVAFDGFEMDPGSLTKPEFAHVDGFHRELSEPVRFSRRLATGAQQFAALVEADTPFAEESHTESWPQPLSEAVRFSKRLATGSQQFAAFVEFAPFAEISRPESWMQPLSDPLRRPRQLPASDQQFSAYTTFDPYWVPALDEPVRKPRQLPTHSQQFAAFVEADTPFIEEIHDEAWMQPLSEIVRYRPFLRTANQQFEMLVQFSFPEASHTEAWTQPLSEPVRFSRRLQPAEQWFLEFTEAIFIVAPPVESYVQPFSLPVFYSKRLQTANQQFWVTSPKPVVLVGSPAAFVTGTTIQAASTSALQIMLSDTTGYFAYAAIATPWVIS